MHLLGAVWPRTPDGKVTTTTGWHMREKQRAQRARGMQRDTLRPRPGSAHWC